jgi:hypothetical protein
VNIASSPPLLKPEFSDSQHTSEKNECPSNYPEVAEFLEELDNLKLRSPSRRSIVPFADIFHFTLKSKLHQIAQNPNVENRSQVALILINKIYGLETDLFWADISSESASPFSEIGPNKKCCTNECSQQQSSISLTQVPREIYDGWFTTRPTSKHAS